jgi:hypothetical protein
MQLKYNCHDLVGDRNILHILIKWPLINIFPARKEGPSPCKLVHTKHSLLEYNTFFHGNMRILTARDLQILHIISWKNSYLRNKARHSLTLYAAFAGVI